VQLLVTRLFSECDIAYFPLSATAGIAASTATSLPIHPYTEKSGHEAGTLARPVLQQAEDMPTRYSERRSKFGKPYSITCIVLFLYLGHSIYRSIDHLVLKHLRCVLVYG
jgi:hypothetical protein